MYRIFSFIGSWDLLKLFLLVLSQLFIALSEPLLLTVIVKAVPFIFNNSSLITFDLWSITLDIELEDFFRIFFSFILLKVILSAGILYIQNFASFYFSKKLSLSLLSKFHSSELSYVENYSKTSLIRFLLYEMETLAKSGFQNLFMLIAEIFIAISIIITVLIEFLDALDVIIGLGLVFSILIIGYLKIVKRGSSQLGKKREVIDNNKLSFISSLFQNLILFKLLDLNSISSRLNYLFDKGIRVAASQTTLEGSFKLLLEFVFYSSICLFFWFNEQIDMVTLNADSLILLIVLSMRLVPSISRILSIRTGFSYVQYILDKVVKELSR